MCDMELSESRTWHPIKVRSRDRAPNGCGFSSRGFLHKQPTSAGTLIYKANTFLFNALLDLTSRKSSAAGDTLRAGPLILASCRVAVADRGACSSSAPHFAASVASSTTQHNKMEVEGASSQYVVIMEDSSAYIHQTTTYFRHYISQLRTPVCQRRAIH